MVGALVNKIDYSIILLKKPLIPNYTLDCPSSHLQNIYITINSCSFGCCFYFHFYSQSLHGIHGSWTSISIGITYRGWRGYYYFPNVPYCFKNTAANVLGIDAAESFNFITQIAAHTRSTN
jgi:hypothetical protein